MRDADDLRRRCPRAEHVRHMADRHHLSARADQSIQRGKIDCAVIIDIEPSQHRAPALAQEVPRHDVRVVLHNRKHDLVTRLDVHAVGDDVDRLGAALGEDDALSRRRIYVARDRFARGFESAGGFVRQRVQAAMHVCVAAAHRGGHRFDHGLGLLSAGGVVEINERSTVHLPRQDREIIADAHNIEGALKVVWLLGRVHACASNHFPIRSRSSASIASVSLSGIAPTRNASISMARACFSGTPRERR